MAETLIADNVEAGERFFGTRELTIPIDQGELLQHECGIAGVYNPSGENTGHILGTMLEAQQNRGQLSAGGGVYGEGSALITGMGLVRHVFPDVIDPNFEPNKLDEKVKNGKFAVGHVRWSTSGDEKGAQPIEGKANDYLIATNGEITNILALAETYELEVEEGESDSSIAARIFDIEMSRNNRDIVTATEVLMKQLEGGFAFVISDGERLVGVRDPWGNRPLVMATYPDGSVRLASETTALGDVEFTEVQPGQIIVADDTGVSYKQIEREVDKHECLFEYIYFSRRNARYKVEHGSETKERSMYDARFSAGYILAEEELERMKSLDDPEELALRHIPDAVVAMPNSAIPGAEGYSTGMGVPLYEGALYKTSARRSYVEDSQEKREEVVKQEIRFKEGFLEWAKGKVIDIVDDSIVSGTTLINVIEALHKAEVAEVHVRIVAPPITDECFTGANIRKTFPGLLADGRTMRQIASHIGADSVSYLSIEGLARSIGKPLGEFCMSCITGEYHLDIPKRRVRDEEDEPKSIVWREAIEPEESAA